eukprot:CCRYP_010446-RA/>CCRYP_010446-RA protein AED:0.08 eAED:0.06 QI:0/0/0/0.5/1/1/2/0/357
MGKRNGKKSAATLDPGCDPKILYNNYLQSCRCIGIEPSPSLKSALTNEDSPNRGVQIIIVGEENNVLGPGGCRALVNAMIGKIDDSDAIKHPFTATKDLRIVRSRIKDGGAIAISTLLFATARRKSVNTALKGDSLNQPEWQMEYLELMDNDIGRDGAMALGRSLSVGMNTTLRSLVLDFNRTLASDGVAALCKGLATNSTLKKLSLKHCGIDEKGGSPLSKMLQFKKLGLILLDLTGNSLGAVGLADLCVGLLNNSSLTTLRLAENSIGRSEEDMKSLKIFADVLSKNTSLTAIDLLHNRIGSEGGAVLLPSIKGSAQITDFKVDANMDDEIYKSLFKMSISKNTVKKKKSSKKHK